MEPFINIYLILAGLVLHQWQEYQDSDVYVLHVWEEMPLQFQRSVALSRSERQGLF